MIKEIMRKSDKSRQIFIWSIGGTILLLVLLLSIKFVFYPEVEVVINPITTDTVPTETASTTPTTPPAEVPLANSKDPAPDTLPLIKFIEVTDGCDIHFGGECLLVRSGPGTEFPEVAKLRNGQVFQVSDTIEKENKTWYKITFDEWLRFPERVTDDWYVSADFVKLIKDVGELTTWDNSYATNTAKKIIVDRTEQKLRAYDGDVLYMEVAVSTGLKTTPTPSGTFVVYKKTPSRYMQGPLPNIPGNQYYDLPGVPWNLYFTQEGAVIHGAYWHDSFGTRYSHGCVNLWPADAEKLYLWADLDTVVDVQN